MTDPLFCPAAGKLCRGGDRILRTVFSDWCVTGCARWRIRKNYAGVFKLENPSAAEAGDGIEPYAERSYLPSFLIRVRTVSVISAPLPSQACSFSLSMLRVPGLVLGL